jgi:hypothetical protein
MKLEPNPSPQISGPTHLYQFEQASGLAHHRSEITKRRGLAEMRRHKCEIFAIFFNLKKSLYHLRLAAGARPIERGVPDQPAKPLARRFLYRRRKINFFFFPKNGFREFAGYKEIA